MTNSTRRTFRTIIEICGVRHWNEMHTSTASFRYFYTSFQFRAVGFRFTIYDEKKNSVVFFYSIVKKLSIEFE